MMQTRNTGRRNFKGHFDFDAFLSAVVAEREKRGISWRQVAKDTGISPSSLTRMTNGHRLDIDGLIAVAAWAGLNVERYYRAKKSEAAVADTVTEVAALLRADPNLSKEEAQHLETLIRASYDYVRGAANRDVES